MNRMYIKKLDDEYRNPWSRGGCSECGGGCSSCGYGCSCSDSDHNTSDCDGDDRDDSPRYNRYDFDDRYELDDFDLLYFPGDYRGDSDSDNESGDDELPNHKDDSEYSKKMRWKGKIFVKNIIKKVQRANFKARLEAASGKPMKHIAIPKKYGKTFRNKFNANHQHEIALTS